MIEYRYEHCDTKTLAKMGDRVQFLFDFKRTPLEKLGQPDELHHAEEVCVRVIVSGTLQRIWEIRGLAGEQLERAAYWYAVEKGIKRGKTTVDLDAYDETLKQPPDTSRVCFAPFNFAEPKGNIGFSA
ncbi:MAG TPA: hypothetical protein VMZ92_03790 [Planctomycetota bacterium]|nr:hypothetical protein [Planctomycetota bacterium]